MTEKVAVGPQTQRFIHSNAARIYQCDICATRPLVISSTRGRENAIGRTNREMRSCSLATQTYEKFEE